MVFKKQSKNFLVIASFMMALSVAIGAFGAHGIKSSVDEYLMAIYNTGVEYQFYNTLGLFVIAFLISFIENNKRLILSAYLLFIGTLIFSFSLYLLVILKASWLGAITPIGGTLMIIAWLIVGFSLIKEIKT